MSFETHEVVLHKGEGIEIEPQAKHLFRNELQAEVDFLVISVPSTRADRIHVEA